MWTVRGLGEHKGKHLSATDKSGWLITKGACLGKKKEKKSALLKERLAHSPKVSACKNKIQRKKEKKKDLSATDKSGWRIAKGARVRNVIYIYIYKDVSAPDKSG